MQKNKRRRPDSGYFVLQYNISGMPKCHGKLSAAGRIGSGGNSIHPLRRRRGECTGVRERGEGGGDIRGGIIVRLVVFFPKDRWSYDQWSYEQSGGRVIQKRAKIPCPQYYAYGLSWLHFWATQHANKSKIPVKTFLCTPYTSRNPGKSKQRTHTWRDILSTPSQRIDLHRRTTSTLHSCADKGASNI